MHISLLQVSDLLKSVCAGVSGSELGRRWVGPLGQTGSSHQPTTHALLSVPFSPQLIPMQAPLKTLLQIGVMPMLNGRGCGGEEGRSGGRGLAGGTRLSLPLPPTERTWRGVQIPLPEGINFVREVVTNHAVSRLWVGGCTPGSSPPYNTPVLSVPQSPFSTSCFFLATSKGFYSETKLSYRGDTPQRSWAPPEISQLCVYLEKLSPNS